MPHKASQDAKKIYQILGLKCTPPTSLKTKSNSDKKMLPNKKCKALKIYRLANFMDEVGWKKVGLLLRFGQMEAEAVKLAKKVFPSA